MRSNKLKVKELKQLAEDQDILQEYAELCFYSNHNNINDTFFNIKSYYTFSSAIGNTKTSFKFAEYLINNPDSFGCSAYNILRIVDPKTKEDALKFFIKYPDFSIYNHNLMSKIDRDDFYDWYKTEDPYKSNYEHIMYALASYLIDGDEFYKIIDNSISFKNMYYNNTNFNPDYTSDLVEKIFNETDYFKSTTLENIKKTIKNFIDVTIKRNRDPEINNLKKMIYEYTRSSNVINISDNLSSSGEKNFYLFPLELNVIDIFAKDDYKKNEHSFKYLNLYKLLNMDQKKMIIDEFVKNINKEFYKKFFKYSSLVILNTINELVVEKTNKEKRDELKKYLFTKLFEDKELFDLIIKDNKYCISTNYIIDKDLFKLIENDHDLLKQIFVYNNKAHYILSRIRKDHPLSKGNYNPNACYGNIWNNKCSSCVYYSEKELSLDNRCSKKFKYVLDLEVKHNGLYFNDVRRFFTPGLSNLFSNN